MLLSMSDHYQTRAPRRYNGAGRTLTNVVEWIRKIDIPEEPYEYAPPSCIQTGPVARNDDRVKRAINAWTIQATIPGVGHSEFWRLACRLAAANCDEHEVYSILKEQAGLARHPQERQHEIPEIIKQLGRKGWLSPIWMAA